MDARIWERAALYCDQGPHEGEYRIELSGTVYLTAEEYKDHGHFTVVEKATE
jgi:hypothetical protein